MIPDDLRQPGADAPGGHAQEVNQKIARALLHRGGHVLPTQAMEKINQWLGHGKTPLKGLLGKHRIGQTQSLFQLMVQRQPVGHAAAMVQDDPVCLIA